MGAALVISAIATYNGHSVIEITACSDGIDLLPYFLKGVNRNGASFSTSLNAAHDVNTLGSLAPGQRLYFSDDSISGFTTFFGFSPTNFANIADIALTGSDYVYVIPFASETPDDEYGVNPPPMTPGQDGFVNGWVGRKSGFKLTVPFDISQWDIFPGATAGTLAKNSDASKPIQLGVYSCKAPLTQPPTQPPTPTAQPSFPPEVPEPTRTPVTPTLKPTNAARPKPSDTDPTPGPVQAPVVVAVTPSQSPIGQPVGDQPVKRNNPPRPPRTRRPRQL